MDAYTYADPVNPNLVCCICRQPFVDPTTASCGHTFCSQCINTALDVSGCCPIDRGALDMGDLMPAPALVRNMVDELIVQCPNNPLGCAHTAQRHLMPSHVAGCTFIPVPCPSCNHTVLQHNAEPHDGDCKHALELCSTCDGLAPESHTCPARPVECPHCAASTPHNLLAQHTQSCPAVPTPCPLSTYGCTHTGPASALEEHLAICPFEPLKPYLALSQSRISALERTVAELKHQLDATKKSLGPWFRSANAPTEPDPPRFEFRPLVGRRRVSSPLHTSMFHFDETEPTTRRRAGSGSNLRVSSTPADMDDPFSHILPPSPTSADHREAVPYIPPLNTSASLEHTLSTLRNGLVSLAASLDMAERRQEVVVTTESLRMHEEVGSMRAIVHGLRMQVSALVMERNVAMMGRMNRGSSSSPSANDRNEERFATETRYYNQHPPPPVNLAVPYSVRRQETNNKL